MEVCACGNLLRPLVALYWPCSLCLYMVWVGEPRRDDRRRERADVSLEASGGQRVRGGTDPRRRIHA